MEQNEKDMDFLEEVGEEGNKVKRWFKDNISIFAIAVICLVYVVYGFIHIKETGKTIVEIIAGGFISFIMGFLIKSLFNAQGVSNGENSNSFKKTKQFYGKRIDEIDNYLQYLPAYCEIKNAQLLKNAQTVVLREKNFKYNKFQSGYYFQPEVWNKLSKEDQTVLNKAKSVKLHYINDVMLLSDCQLTIDVGKDLSTNKNNYLKKSNMSAMVMMVASAILFGYFTPTAEVDWSGAIWSLIQVAWFLGVGVTQYFKGYNFMTDKYRSIIIKKANFLKEFKNMYEEDPQRFKELEEVEERKEQLIQPQNINEIEKTSQKVNENVGIAKEVKTAVADTNVLEKVQTTNPEIKTNATEPILKANNKELKEYVKPDAIVSSFN